MTTYTAIAGTETQSGKPLTESLMTRLANNLLAVVEGDPTAPQFFARAIEQNSGTIDEETARASAGVIQAIGGGYNEYLNISVDNDFLGSVIARVQLVYEFNSGGGAGGNQANMRVRLNGVDAQYLGSYSESSNSLSSTITITLPVGTNEISFQADSSTSLPSPDFTGSMRITAQWL